VLTAEAPAAAAGEQDMIGPGGMAALQVAGKPAIGGAGEPVAGTLWLNADAARIDAARGLARGGRPDTAGTRAMPSERPGAP